MNNKLRNIFVLSLIVIGISILLNIPFNRYKNNILYSEKDLSSSNVIDSNNKDYATREEAVSKTLKVFENGFKIDLDRENLYENIDLNKNEDKYEWSILLYENDGLDSIRDYYCSISADSGEIYNIGIYEYKKIQNYKENKALNINKAKEIIQPLAHELNINIGDSYFDYSYSSGVRVICKDNKNKSISYRFDIDYDNEKIIAFRKSIKH